MKNWKKKGVKEKYIIDGTLTPTLYSSLHAASIIRPQIIIVVIRSWSRELTWMETAS